MKIEGDEPPVITIDGPGGTGKGTIAVLLKRWLGWNFLDSGALYRALGFLVVEKKISIDDEEKLIDVASHMEVYFDYNGGENSIYVYGKDVTNLIRTEECGAIASKIAARRQVRLALLKRQRAFQCPPGLIADGRDMGTTVFPSAKLKIYLTASINERAQRRYKQLKQKGITARLPRLFDEIKSRDERDSQRGESPMKPAQDAEIVDTTELSIRQVESYVKQLVIKRLEDVVPKG